MIGEKESNFKTVNDIISKREMITEAMFLVLQEECSGTDELNASQKYQCLIKPKS